ncbi:MAG TPA: Gfo/Idh/MocA family oxidoreductase [Armatimonadota bacterium]|nr:Gfo/Idh/MocA family oxidoreductase [Armatimonadota bacterium]
MIGIGIIGAGRICAAHASAAVALPETRLAAVAEVDAERLERATATYGCKGYADYREMLADPEVEAVVVGLPHWLHHEVTVTSLDAGRHVLLEKPMGMSVAECDAMVEAAERSGKTLMVAHSQHFFPVNLAAKRLLEEGGIGTPVLATDTWYKPFYEGVRPEWFLDGARGGGMWPMNGSHMIDRLTFFLGGAITSVKARVGSPIFGLSATDMGAAFFQFDHGACATLMHVGYRDGVNRFEAEITGTEGQLKVSGDRGGGDEIWVSRAGQWEAIPAPPVELLLKPGATLRGTAFALQMREFALSILEGRPPAVTAEYGRQVVRVLEACEESSRTGREVRLD